MQFSCTYSRLSDADFCHRQVTAAMAMRPFVKITLDRLKLHLRKSSFNAAFCRITAAMAMRPFVQLLWIGIDFE